MKFYDSDTPEIFEATAAERLILMMTVKAISMQVIIGIQI